MKSEHRHQLKTNELAEWMVNFPQWAKENATTITYVSVVVVLVAGAYFWKVYEKKVVSVRKQIALTNAASQLSNSKTQILRAQTQGVDIGYTLIQNADRLQEIAQNSKDNDMAAMALIKQAEALRTELHYRAGNISKENFTNQINRAKQSYTNAIEKASGNPSLTAMAKFGLGLCEEELGNFEQARQIYNEIVTNPDFEYTVIVPQAKLRLDTMAAYEQKVVFKPAPKRKQTTAEVTPPGIELEMPQGSPSQMGPFEVPDFNSPGPEHE